MNKEYWKIAFRRLILNKVFVFTNIIGLTIGLFLYILLTQFINYETGYDRDVSPNVYRCYMEEYSHGELERTKRYLWLPFGSEVKKTIPGVKDYFNLFEYTNSTITTDNGEGFFEDNLISADTSIIHMFSLKIIKGSTKDVYNKCIISNSLAKKYFGEQEPVGKVLKWKSHYFERDIEVSAVFEDRMPNTHRKLDIICFSMGNLHFGDLYYNNWGFRIAIFPTYFELEEGADVSKIETLFKKIVKEKVIVEDGENRDAIVKLQKVYDCHLDSNQFDYEQGNSISWSTLIQLIILFVILIFSVWMNYFNISSLMQESQFHKDYMRRVLGASKFVFLAQIVVENLILNVIVLIISVGIALGFQSAVLNFFELPKEISLLNDKFFYLIIFGYIICNIIVFSTISYLLCIGRFKQIRKSKRVIGFNNISAIFQLILIYVILTGSIFFLNQIKFMKETDLGFEKNEIILFQTPFSLETIRYLLKMTDMREELKKYPEIVDVANSVEVMGYMTDTKVVAKLADQDSIETMLCDVYNADEYIFNTYNIKFLAGGTFTRVLLLSDYGLSDNGEIVINEKMSKKLGFKDPNDAIGKQVVWDNGNFKSIICGVVKNVHHKSLYSPIRATLYNYVGYLGDWYSLRYTKGQSNKAIQILTATWNKSFPNKVLQYYHLDDFLESKSYGSFYQFFNLLKLFTFSIILTTCIGLLGFIWQMTFLKLKDIAIRKTMGASEFNVYWFYMKKAMINTTIAIIIGVPLSYYLWNTQLSGFEYKIKLEPVYFVISAVALFLIVLGTMSFTALKAAYKNPVNILREANQ